MPCTSFSLKRMPKINRTHYRVSFRSDIDSKTNLATWELLTFGQVVLTSLCTMFFLSSGDTCPTWILEVIHGKH